MSPLPIRSLTLYKQGIGYFERWGLTEETGVSLVIPREATNDVLKSLNVVIREGGPVVSVDYETPADKEKVLNELPVKLSDRSSMVDLLSSLRGSTVTLQLDNDETSTGRLVGVEASLTPESQPSTVLIQDGLDFKVFPVSRLRGLTLRDERAATDVNFFLDVSRTEQTQTTLTVRLQPGRHDLGINYLAPSPTWRMSYRLIGDGNGQARLIAWGLFENSLDEDLENVALTLISARPISFEYQLYESRTPSRPEVSDDQNTLESMAGNPLLAESFSVISHELRTPLVSINGFAELLAEGAVGSLTEKQKDFVNKIRDGSQRMSKLMEDLLDMVRLKDRSTGATQTPIMMYRSGPLGDLKVSSSYFVPIMMGNAEPEYLTYRVSSPVSVRRGQSAIVPILDAAVAYQDLYVYNEAKMPNHPLRVWRLQNVTGVALEQGPVTVVESGRYLGEGLVRFSGVDDDIQIPYALEFGVLITQEQNSLPRRLHSVVFSSTKRLAEVSWHHITEYTYTLTSRVNREMRIQIERRDPSRGDYFEMPLPDLALAGHTRWSVVVPPKSRVKFTVREREMRTNDETVSNWRSSYVDELREAGAFTEATYETLRKLLQEQEYEADVAKRIKGFQEEYAQKIGAQDQLRKNISTLGTSKREVTIRDRILDDLEASEDRRRFIETTLADLSRETRQHQTNQQSFLNEIFKQE